MRVEVFVDRVSSVALVSPVFRDDIMNVDVPRRGISDGCDESRTSPLIMMSIPMNVYRL